MGFHQIHLHNHQYHRTDRVSKRKDCYHTGTETPDSIFHSGTLVDNQFHHSCRDNRETRRNANKTRYNGRWHIGTNHSVQKKNNQISTFFISKTKNLIFQ